MSTECMNCGDPFSEHRVRHGDNDIAEVKCNVCKTTCGGLNPRALSEREIILLTIDDESVLNRS